MANQKANKQALLDKQPILNLARNTATVDNQMQQWERINGPYLNDMLSPVYVKNLGHEYIHDKDGNKYTIDAGAFKKNGSTLFSVTNRKLVKSELDWEQYIAYDIDDTWKDGDPTAYAVFNTHDNTITINYGTYTYTTGSLYTNGTIIRSRIRILNNHAVFVAYLNADSVDKVLYIRVGSGTAYRYVNASWKKQVARYSASGSYTPTSITIQHAEPFISICYNEATSLYCVSLIDDYGFMLNARTHGFITFVESNGVFNTYGTDFSPNSNATPSVITTKYYNNFTIRTSTSNETINGSALSTDGETFYDYVEEGVVGPQLNFPTTYVPTVTSAHVTIDNVTYTVYNYTCKEYTDTMIVRVSNTTGTFQGVCTHNDGTAITVHGGVGDTAKTATYTRRYYRGQNAVIGWASVAATWTYGGESVTESVPAGYWNQSPYEVYVSVETVGTSSWLVAPNVFLDNGNMYSMWDFQQSVSSWISFPVSTPANVLIESARLTGFSNNTYTFDALETVSITGDNCNPRTVAFTMNQNFWQSNIKLCNNDAATPATMYAATDKAETGANAKYMEYVNTNTTDLTYLPGTVRGSSSYASSYFNYYTEYISEDPTNGPLEDFNCWTPNGWRTELTDNWHLLFNTTVSGTCYIQGISYSEDDEVMGTLVSPWQQVAEDGIVVANTNNIIWKGTDGHFYNVTVEEGNVLAALLDDRYILVNTTSFWNMYDSETMKKYHYASDYNNRRLHGVLTPSVVTGAITRIRSVASAVNGAFNITKEYVSSMIWPYSTLYRVDTNVSLYGCIEPDDNDTQGIDIYYADLGIVTTPQYRFTKGTHKEWRKFALDGSTYPISSTATGYVNTSLFAVFIDGQGNNDGVIEGRAAYTLAYSTSVPSPTFNYSVATATYNMDAFFVLQGQFYAVMDDKIYSLIFSNGVISERDAIIDCAGMQFLGNNTQIAFFWSQSMRMIYSFTGDGNLLPLYNSSKFTTVLNDKYTHFYDTMTQSIYIPTDKGLLVLGPKSYWMFENWKDVTNVQTSDDHITHITNSGVTYDVVYYPTAGYEPLPLELETTFYGAGANEIGSIDRYAITLFDYDNSKPSTYITVGTRTLTDISVKSSEKTFEIKPNDWDKFSHAVLINYNPEKIQGQGVRLYLKTPMIVSGITAHIADRGTTTPTRHNI